MAAAEQASALAASRASTIHTAAHSTPTYRHAAAARTLNRAPTPAGRCAIGAGILFMCATLAVVGLGALAAGAEHVGPAILVALVGLVAWVGAAALVAAGTADLRGRSRGLGAAAVLLCWAPGVALWIVLAVSFHNDPEHPSAPWLFTVVAGMVVPAVMTAAGVSRQGVLPQPFRR